MKHAELIKSIASIKPILADIALQKGISYLVGGSVRDLVLQKPIYDIDIEVHQLTEEQLIAILKKQGTVHLVGKKFGVFRVGSIDIDWSLPRTDSIGRKPIITLDPNMGIEAALGRRDLRMNALALQLTSDANNNFGIDVTQIIDPFGGMNDIKQKKLGMINPERFVEDPLRLYRVIQYISRFAMTPDDELTTIAQTMSLLDPATQKSLASERIGAELIKLLTLSAKPSEGLSWAIGCKRPDPFFPFLAILDNKESLFAQRSALEQTYKNIDTLADFFTHPKINQYFSQHEKKQLFVSLLFAEHCYKTKSSYAKEIVRYGLGVNPHDITKLLHALHTLQNTNDSIEVTYKRVAHYLSPHWRLVDALLACACIFQQSTLEENILLAEKLTVVTKPIPPLLSGAYFIEQGLTGSAVGKALEQAYELQITQNISDAEILKKHLADHFAK